MTRPSVSGLHVELKSPSAKIRRRPQRNEAELVLPPDAVGMKLRHHVEDHEVVAQLLPARALVEVPAPVEREALLLHESERGVDALLFDAAAAVDDPRLVNLVLGEAVLVEEARAEVAVDHAHRRVAEHHDEHGALADGVGDDARSLGSLLRHRRVVDDLVGGVGDASGRAPLVEALHEGLVGGPIRCVGPRARERAAEALEARARVEKADETGPSTGEVTREKERIVLGEDPIGRMRPVEPVHAHPDERVVDGPELLEGLVGLREEAGHAVRLAPELLQSALELRRRLGDAR